MGQTLRGTAGKVSQWGYSSGKQYSDPFNQIELDVLVTDPEDRSWHVPAFWTGEQSWAVRFAAPRPGHYEFQTICSDATNSDLHGQTGVIDVEPYAGTNPLFSHGPLQVRNDRRHLEHADGTPFFWLADTWWLGLCQRLSWPGDFLTLTNDRVAKRFSVVQIIAGLYPDMPPLDPRGANEAGFPWEEGFTRINPAYFAMADLRINHLVEAGLLPCLVGCWGYFLPVLGIERMKQHWRYLVARYGAYPAVWCLAGEGVMPYYQSPDPDADRVLQREGWTELARYVRAIDPFKHVLTIHPSGGSAAHLQLDDPSLLDFDMLQTGAGGPETVQRTVATVAEAIAFEPRMPVINGEVCYEGQFESNREEVQWFMFWSCVLSGAAGHTYGANGIWQVNTREKPFGPSPWGAAWGDQPWEDAYRLPGSGQLGLAKRLLERYEWWRFEPHPEWVEPHATVDEPLAPYAAGIPDGVRIVYLPKFLTRSSPPHVIKGLMPNAAYRAYFFNPVDGRERPIGSIQSDAAGTWRIPLPPVTQPWVVVVEPAAG